eukprot:scaffold21883_cov199-Amphora_coffeaeformis.AAC.2
MVVRGFVNNKNKHVPVKKKVPAKYDKFLQYFQNVPNKDQYNLLFDSTQGRQVLNDALEQFIQDYDAQIPFDGHLRLQIPRLTNPETGRTVRLDALYDTTNMSSSFQELGNWVDMASPVEVIHGYDRGTKRMDIKELTLQTRQKICQLSAIDCCCLNYELPPECQNLVACRWIRNPLVGSSSDDEELLIEPVPTTYPPKVVPRDFSLSPSLGLLTKLT